MAAEPLGRCKCPVCASTKARLSLSKSGLATLTCNACNFQGFARSGTSDELLRARIVTDAPAAPAPAPATLAPTPPPAAPMPPPIPAALAARKLLPW